MSSTLITLLIIYQVKHFLADYPLQTPYMLGKFKGGWDWVNPLALHCNIHALMTVGISFAFTRDIPFSATLGVLDFVVHFIMDRIKASPNILGRFVSLSKTDFNTHDYVMDQLKQNAKYVEQSGHAGISTKIALESTYWAKRLKSNQYFWWSLGLDQGVHHLTHYVIIFFIMGHLK